MKKVALIICCIILSTVSGKSQKVEDKVIKKVAQNAFKFYKKTTKNPSDLFIKEIIPIEKETDGVIFVVNFEDKGFVIVSDDYSFNPVLGCCTTNNFDQEDISPGLEYLLSKFSYEIANAKSEMKNTNYKEKAKWDKLSYMFNPGDPNPNPEPEPDEDMLNTAWGQGNDYNARAPLHNGTLCPAGCTAVALAQVLYFWSCQVDQNGINQYYDSVLDTTLIADFGNTEYHWIDMDTSNADDDNAELIYHAGVSIYSKYRDAATTVNNPWIIEDALEDFFGFNTSTNFKWRSGHLLTWHTLLVHEIEYGRPIIYNAGHILPTYGHTWVISGYDELTDAFWCNWGWEGYQDGYYQLNAFENAVGEFNEVESAIFGAEPTLSYQVALPQLIASTIQSEVNYITIPPAIHATSYEWTTTHGTIAGNGTTATLTTTESAMVCVRAYNSNCDVYSGWDCEMMTIVDPEITGPDIICPGGNHFILENYDPSATITWSKSSNVQWSGEPIGPSAWVDENTSSDGAGWVQVTLEYMGMPDDVITKDIWIGNPMTPTISGPTTIDCGTSYYYTIPSNSVETSSFPTSWTVTGSLEITSYNNYHCYVKSDYSGSGTLTATLNNCNGISSYVLPIEAFCVNPMAYPNPTGDILNLDSGYEGTDVEEYVYDLVNDKGEKKKTKKVKVKKTTIDVTDLPEGTYVLVSKLHKKDGAVLNHSQQIIIAR